MEVAKLRGRAAFQLTIAGLHEHDLREPERRHELLIIWAWRPGSSFLHPKAGKHLGTKIAAN